MVNPHNATIAACDNDAKTLIRSILANDYTDDDLLGFTAEQNRENDIRRIYTLGIMREIAVQKSMAWLLEPN